MVALSCLLFVTLLCSPFITRLSLCSQIEWDGAVDVRGVDIDADVLICQNESGKPEVAVYHEYAEADACREVVGTRVKPRRGELLNRSAVITLENVHAGAGASLAEERLFAEKIERRTHRMDCKLISYDAEAGQWKFRCSGF